MVDEIFEHTSHNDVEEVDEQCFQYADVIFKVDFGAFKAGDKCDLICMDYKNGVMEEYGHGGDAVLRSVPMRLFPR
jgi:hypothetical protein